MGSNRTPTEEAARLTKALRSAGLPVTNRKNGARWEGEGLYVTRVGVSRTLSLGYRDAVAAGGWRPRTEAERLVRNEALGRAREVIAAKGLSVDDRGFIELGRN